MSTTTDAPIAAPGHSRRSVIRKAAYVAPVVFAIAAAPNVALGSSGANKPSKTKKAKKAKK